MPAEIRAQAIRSAAGRNASRHHRRPGLPRWALRQRFEVFYRAPQLRQEHSNPSAVEAASHENWQSRDAYRVTENATRADGSAKPKFYACSMLPYPSGKLHMGHVRNYTINDMMTRQLRMRGYNVLMPMGWDAFGMPAENAAIKSGVPPAQWTYDNIAYMKKQMRAMGLAIDWSREMCACDPKYYKWNQWLFLKMLEKGIDRKSTRLNSSH